MTKKELESAVKAKLAANVQVRSANLGGQMLRSIENGTLLQGKIISFDLTSEVKATDADGKETGLTFVTQKMRILTESNGKQGAINCSLPTEFLDKLDIGTTVTVEKNEYEGRPYVSFRSIGANVGVKADIAVEAEPLVKA